MNSGTWHLNYFSLTCFVFIVERKLHKTNSKYRLFLILHYIYVCIIIKSCYFSCKCYLYLIFIFSNFTTPQSPTGGTSGLCFKKLNITTSSYRIIINRLDRKVNLCLIYCQEFNLSHMNNTGVVCLCVHLFPGDSELQTCSPSILPSLSLCGRHGQHVLDPYAWWGQHTVVSQHRHHGAAVHHNL